MLVVEDSEGRLHYLGCYGGRLHYDTNFPINSIKHAHRRFKGKLLELWDPLPVAVVIEVGALETSGLNKSCVASLYLSLFLGQSLGVLARRGQVPLYSCLHHLNPGGAEGAFQ